MIRFVYRIKNPLSLLYSLIFSLLTWLVFYPGILSLDSIYMYLEAAGKFPYTDEKALLLPLTLALVLKAGGKLSVLILFQCIAGFLAVRYLALSIAAQFQLDARKRDLAGLLVLFVLSSPLFLAFIYMNTFWMDTWLAIIMLLAVGLLLELYSDTNPGTGLYKIRLFALVVVISLALLVRLNSFVLYPVLALGMLLVLQKSNFRSVYKVFLALCPIAIFGLFMLFQYNVLKVNKSYQDHTVLALDLASVLKYDPSVCHKAILSACDVLSDDYPCKFQLGNGALDCTYDQAQGIVYRPFYFLRNNSALETDTGYVIQNYPLTWLKVKFLNFCDYLRPVAYRYFFQVQDPVLNTQANLFPNSRFSILRRRIFSELSWVSQNPFLRWFSFVHLPWLLIDVLGIIACVVRTLRPTQRGRALFFAAILCIPASYYFSYLMALTASDFRFMFPSTLVMQVVTLSSLFLRGMQTMHQGKRELDGQPDKEAAFHS